MLYLLDYASYIVSSHYFLIAVSIHQLSQLTACEHCHVALSLWCATIHVCMHTAQLLLFTRETVLADDVWACAENSESIIRHAMGG